MVEITEQIRNDFRELMNLLKSQNYPTPDCAHLLDDADDTKLWDYLTSNSLWGGAGSIADQALLEIPQARIDLEKILIRLGRSQESIGRVNVRTEMWVSFFEDLRASNHRS